MPPATAQGSSAASLRIGISGWTYAGWRGVFYPRGLRQRDELRHASRQLNSIEINGSFYSLQKPESYASWYAQTPADFLFSVKGPRFVTHMKKLRGAEPALANFFASGVLALREKLGPLLWQLPPQLPFDAERLRAFFAQLPRTTAEAAELGSRHEERMKDRTFLVVDAVRPLRHCLEVRHVSYESPEFVALLREHDVALVTADTAGKWPFLEDQTSGFAYVRLHGSEELYVSGYDDAALDSWADKVRAWSAGRDPVGARLAGPTVPTEQEARDVFVYFDNDVKVRAPFDALGLAGRLGLTAGVGS